MALLKRRSHEEVLAAKALLDEQAEQDKAPVTVQDLCEGLRELIRSVVRPGMQSHEVQDATRELCAQVDELELTVAPKRVE